MNAQSLSNTATRFDAVTSRPQSPIESRFDELDCSLNALYNTTEELLRRFSPVVTPYPVEIGGQSKQGVPKAAQSEYANRIEDLTAKVRDIQNKMQEALANAQI